MRPARYASEKAQVLQGQTASERLRAPHPIEESEMCYECQNFYANQAAARRSLLKQWLAAAIASATLVTACTLASDPADDERATARAFHPSKPSHAQQVAFREDAREQLHLQSIVRGGL